MDSLRQLYDCTKSTIPRLGHASVPRHSNSRIDPVSSLTCSITAIFKLPFSNPAGPVFCISLCSNYPYSFFLYFIPDHLYNHGVRKPFLGQSKDSCCEFCFPALCPLSYVAPEHLGDRMSLQVTSTFVFSIKFLSSVYDLIFQVVARQVTAFSTIHTRSTIIDHSLPLYRPKQAWMRDPFI